MAVSVNRLTFILKNQTDLKMRLILSKKGGHFGIFKKVHENCHELALFIYFINQSIAPKVAPWPRVTYEDNMKIYLVTRSLSGVVGGVERQLGKIAMRLSESQNEVSILSSDREKPKVFYPLLENFPLITYGDNIASSDSANLQRVKRQANIWNLIRREKPDLIISFMMSGFIVALPSAIVTRTPIVLAERNSPDVYSLTKAKKLKPLYFLIMRASAVITVQLDTYVKRYPKYLRKRIKVIYNEIEIIQQNSNDKAESRPFTFGFVGRFSHQKQPIRLLESFARHISKGNNSRIIFFGNGDLEPKMKDRIFELNIQDYVTIRGPVQDLNKVYGAIDCLCLPSLWEGFPNVVGEAMMYGIPVLGSIGCTGLSDLLANEVGLLVDFENTNNDPFVDLIDFVDGSENLTARIQSQIKSFQELNFTQRWKEVVVDATSK